MSTSEPRASRRHLVLSVALMILGVSLVDIWLSHHVTDHVVFEASFRDAVGVKSSSVLVLGDSRMVEGIDRDLMNASLWQGGRPRRVAYLAIGGVDIPGQFLTLRRFLERSDTSLVVLGYGSTLLVPPTEPHRDPDEMIGNLAIELAWSEAADVYSFFPGFPFRHTEPGFRFLLNRQTALGSYRSIAWYKVSQWRDRLVGKPPRAMNKFGALDDMRMLVDAFASNARQALNVWQPTREEGIWFRKIADRAANRAIPLLLVDVPMHSDYLKAVTSHPRFAAYTAALQDDLKSEGISRVDFSGLEAAAGDDFPDTVHLGSKGRERFTRALAPVIAHELDRATRPAH